MNKKMCCCNGAHTQLNNNGKRYNNSASMKRPHPASFCRLSLVTAASAIYVIMSSIATTGSASITVRATVITTASETAIITTTPSSSYCAFSSSFFRNVESNKRKARSTNGDDSKRLHKIQKQQQRNIPAPLPFLQSSWGVNQQQHYQQRNILFPLSQQIQKSRIRKRRLRRQREKRKQQGNGTKLQEVKRLLVENEDEERLSAFMGFNSTVSVLASVLEQVVQVSQSLPKTAFRLPKQDKQEQQVEPMTTISKDEYERRKEEWASKYTSVHALREKFGDNHNKIFGDLDAATTRRLYKTLLPRALMELYDGLNGEVNPEDLAPLAYKARLAAKLYARERCKVIPRTGAILYDGLRQLKQYGKFQPTGVSYDQLVDKYKDHVTQTIQEELETHQKSLHYHEVTDDDITAMICLKIIERSCQTNDSIDKWIFKDNDTGFSTSNNGDDNNFACSDSNDNEINKEKQKRRRELEREQQKRQQHELIHAISEQLEHDVEKLLKLSHNENPSTGKASTSPTPLLFPITLPDIINITTSLSPPSPS